MPSRAKALQIGVILVVLVAAVLAVWRLGADARMVSGGIGAGSTPQTDAAPTPKTYYEVRVDGSPIGLADSRETVDNALRAVVAELPDELRERVIPESRVTVASVQLAGVVPVVAGQTLLQTLKGSLPRLAPVWAINVDGRDVITVGSQIDAEQAIKAIQDDYRQTFLRGAASVQQIRFLESIGFREKWALAEDVRSLEQARDILRFGTDKRIFYTVQRGDTLWDIAAARGMAVADIAKANPGVDEELIQPGQELSMTVKEPLVHLESVETQVYTESIPFPETVGGDPELWPWEQRVIVAGERGVRRITARVVRKDGKEVDREVLEREVLAQPKRQQSVRGTRQAPAAGTGSFFWPLQGEITSDYGPRWGGWHPGIDIANVTGTPVRAADSGTVVYADWMGNYGIAVQIDHGQGTVVTVYGHLSRVAVNLGERVEKGEVIGYVGSTGRSTGPHLHFEARMDGRSVNPLRFYP